MKSFLTRSTAVVALLTFGIVGAQAGKAPQNDIIDTAVAAGPTVADYGISDARAFRVATDHVMLAYLARYRRPNDDITEAMYVSSLWSLIEGRWHNVFSQDTPVGGPDSVV